MNDNPLLLMDVDGPLNPFDAPWFLDPEPADGFRFYHLTTGDDRTYRVALNEAHGRALNELRREFDLGWATTWRHDANRLISPILGLPEDLPVVPLVRRATVGRVSWKAQQVAEWVGPRPFAWFDDELNRATRAWLRDKEWLAPCLLLRVPPGTGLTAPDFDRLRSFAQSL